MNELKNDTNLREAVSRREQKMPPLPADLNERLMQRLEEPETAPKAKTRRLWFYAAIAAVASIALFIIFNFRKEQTPQESLVAQTIEQTMPENQGDRSLIRDEARNQATCPPDSKPTQKPVKKQRKVVMMRVELIPTSEAKSDNVKELPASLIAKVKAYDQPSDPSRMTGIDDTEPFVARTTGIDDTDPLVAMAAQVEDIRQRGQHLEQEIEKRMDN
jgi:hypothetical protein